jgi:hypothetical protein
MERRAILAEGKMTMLEELLLLNGQNLQEAPQTLSALALHLRYVGYVEFVDVFWAV